MSPPAPHRLASRRFRGAAFGAIVAIWALAAAPGVALAQGQVRVRLTDGAGRPVDGTVTLSGTTRASCRTTAGSCTLRAAPGDYQASVRPVRGSAPAPRRVRVTRGGSVSLSFRVGSAPATAPLRPGSIPTGSIRPAPSRPGVSVRPSARPGVRTVPRASPTRPAPPRPVARPGSPAVTTRPATTRPATPRTPRPAPRVAPALRPGPTVRPNPAVSTVRPSPTTRPAPGVTVRPGTTPTTPPSPFVRPATATARPGSVTPGGGRDLSRGGHLCAQGQVLDSVGRPVDATLSFSAQGRALGQVRTTAGRFSLFDLAPGRYSVRITPTRGAPQTASVNLPAGVARLVLRVR